MRVFGFDLTVTKAAPPRSLQGVDTVGGERGWVTVHDFVPGAWQQDVAPVNDARALSNWAFFSCMTLIAADIGKLAPVLKAWSDSEEIYDTVDSAAVTPLLQQPNDYQTWPKFIQSWMLSKVSRGNTYILLERDQRNVVVAMHV